MSKVLVHLVLLAFLIQSCAAPYRSIQPETLLYNSIFTDDEGIEYSTKYELLKLTKNKKYEKKSAKKNIHIASFKITNNSNSPIYFEKDIEVLMGKQLVKPLPVDITFKKLKQRPALHLFYLLLSGLRYRTSVSANEYSPIGFVIGPGLTGANMGLAISANKKFKHELIKFDLVHKKIEVGETVYGLISFPSFGLEPLSLKLKKN